MEKFSSRFWWMVDGWKVCSCTCNTGGNRSSKRFITRIRIYFRNRLYGHTCKSRNSSCSTVRLPIYEMDLGERWNRAPWFSGQTGLIFHGSLYVCASSTLSVIRVDRGSRNKWVLKSSANRASCFDQQGSREKGRKEKMKNIETTREERWGKGEKERERENEVSINSQEVRHRCQFHGAIGGHETARWGKRKVSTLVERTADRCKKRPVFGTME